LQIDTTKKWLKESLSNAWFVVSVVVTVFLILILAWNLVYSYRSLDAFKNRELALERAAGQILNHAKTMEMAAHMAAATGDLRWQDTYREHRILLENTFDNLPPLPSTPGAANEKKVLRENMAAAITIESQVFALVSRGRKNEASTILAGWTYTKNKMELENSIETVTAIIHAHVSEELAFQKSVSRALLVVILICMGILIVSWTISIVILRSNYLRRKEKEAEILYLSYHDALTGLYNRRFFEKEVERLNVERQLPLAIILGDVNDLKLANDTYGHKKGDALLKEIADILRGALRKEDIIARWGGDEFGILLPNTTREEMSKIIDRIKAGCDKSAFTPIKPSISVGWAIKNNITESMEQVFTQAENRMYRSKNRPDPSQGSR